MSTLDAAQLAHLAALARLELWPDEVPALLVQLEGVLELFATLPAVELAGDADAEALAQESAACSLRDDDVAPAAPRETLFTAGNLDADGLLVVPPVTAPDND